MGQDDESMGSFYRKIGGLALAFLSILIPLLAIIIPVALLYSVYMGAEGSMLSAANDKAANEGKTLDAQDAFWWDPQNIIDNMDTLLGYMDTGSEGHSYMTSDDLKMILKAIVTYRKLVRKDIVNKYTYYYHDYSWTENPPESGGEDEEDDGDTAPAEPTYTVVDDVDESYGPETALNSSIEDEPIYAVSWQEIYAFVAMKTLIDEGNAKNWEDQEIDRNGRQNTVATKRIDPTLLCQLINSFSFEFGYYFDPTQSPGTVYQYRDMESNAYILVKEGANVEHGTEVAGTTPAFTYKEKKIPAVAPAEAKNCYTTVEYVYEGNVLKGRVITVDGLAYVKFAESILGEGNFEFDWFMDKLRLLPGAEYDPGDGSGTLISRYEKVYESYKDGKPITYFDTSIPGVGSVRLGSGLDTSNVHNEIIDVTNNNGVIDASAIIKIVPSWTGSHKEFIEKIAAIAMELWEKYHILPSLTIAQAIVESGWGAHHCNGNNLFGIKANGIQSADSPWDGSYANCWTWEEINGQMVRVQANFRAYDKIEDSVVDHAIFLNQYSHYEGIVGETDWRKAVEELGNSGYATSSSYYSSVYSVIEAYGLDSYDRQLLGN